VAIAQKSKSPAAPPQPQRVSFNPDTQTQGFLDDVDVEITDAQTCMFDYNGQQAEQPALCLELTDVNGGQHAQYWTAGQSADWAPTEDGTGFVALSGKTGFNAQANVAMLFKSILEAGDDTVVDILNSGDCKQLIGMKVHVKLKELERKGLIRKQSDRPPTVLLVEKIIALPGVQGKAAPRAAGKAAATTAAKPAGGKPNGAAAKSDDASDIDAVLVEKLMEALAETDPLPKKTLLQLASGAFKGTPQHSAAIKRSSEANFLKSLSESGISFDGAQFSLA
jgi:hypothetical protein